MKTFIFRELLAPLATRCGTALAAILVTKTSADPSLALDFGVAITAVILVGVDLVASHVARLRATPSPRSDGGE